MTRNPRGAAPPDAARASSIAEAAAEVLPALLSISPDGVLSIDARGRVAAWNDALVAQWQLPRNLLRAADARALAAHMVGRAPQAAEMLERLPSPGEVDVGSQRITTVDGRLLEWTATSTATGGAVHLFREVTDAAAAGEQARTAEASYRTIFDLATEAMYLHDPVTGDIVDVNRRAMEFHGRSREEFIRMGIGAVSAGESPYSEVEALERVRRAGRGEPQLFVWRARHASGRMLWIEVSLRPARIGGVARVLATARDVTERMEAEAVLQRSQEELERAVEERTAALAAAHAAVREREAQYRALADADPDGIVVLDDDSTILSANPAMTTIFGHTAEELVGRPLTILMPEELRAAHREGIARYLRTGERRIPWVGVQVPGLRRDGSRVDLEINFGEYTLDGRRCFAGFIRDITDRKKAEESLRFQSALLEAQNEASIDGILVAHEGRVLSMNRRYADIFNVPEELRPLDRCQEMLRWAVEQAADPAGYVRSIEALRHDPETRHRDEVLLADGRVLDRYSSPLLSPDGELWGRIWVVRDITARKEIEAALQSAKEEAERANLAKSEFLSRMSHELRTPLNSILGFGQVLQRRDLQPDQRRAVDHILKAGHHLLALIDEVLDISRIESNRQQLSIEPVHLRGILEEALALIRPVAQQRLVSLPPQTPNGADVHVRADRQRLMQVVLNLLSNAVKYNRRTGEVELLVEPRSEGRIAFGVRDTGPGIPPARMGELFLPFSRLGAEHGGVEGTGLGLALSRRLVEAMGGGLRADSVEGRGSTFWVELPVAEHPLIALGTRPRAVHRAQNEDVQPRPLRVLYIEDNLANLNLVESIFEDRPEVQLLPALQGRMGLELARQHLPDVVLLDLHLPDMNGEEVLRALLDDPLTRDIPVMVISADATPRQIARLKAAGARAYLTKPLDLDEFMAVFEGVRSQEPGAEGE